MKVTAIASSAYHSVGRGRCPHDRKTYGAPTARGLHGFRSGDPRFRDRDEGYLAQIKQPDDLRQASLVWISARFAAWLAASLHVRPVPLIDGSGAGGGEPGRGRYNRRTGPRRGARYGGETPVRRRRRTALRFEP